MGQNKQSPDPRNGTEDNLEDASVAATLEAMHRIAFESDLTDSVSAENSGALLAPGCACPACGIRNPKGNKFCSACGVPLPETSSVQGNAATNPASVPTNSPGQHNYHHHYHHHYFYGADGMMPAFAPGARSASPASPRDAAGMRVALGGPALSRVEVAVRRLAQDWVQACNTKQLNDLVELYGTDASVLRPNFPLVRGAAAIREFFVAVMDSGLGDVEMEPLRVELFGDMAYEAGRCKMLVPVATGKRREERGKYLIVMNRQASGEWKIMADCWSSDLNLGVPAESVPAKPNTPTPPNSRR